ncbi:hypothetical protein FO441_08825 [Salinicoccus cyprini]|uniref:ABC transporter permease n=1 Tax=Salinicoccus cyprini TaxID=2493691 RepID=A0A558AU60_9STAP|nr:hypothetical protein [Salinicoccus cyprini]TVT27798.1 hypothetical protein FO441_08825 [Salinicoccus cyprini]
MRLFRWETLKVVRDWKVRILLAALLLFVATYSTLYQNRTIQLPVDETIAQYTDTQNLFRAIPEAHFETETGQDIYDRLARQQQILGMQRFILSEKEGNTVEGLEEIVSDYVDQGIEMAENQLYFYKADDFESQELLLSFMPSEAEINNRLKFLNYLDENDVAIDWNPMSPSLVLHALVNIIAGVFIYIIAAIFGADRFSRDQENNWSITQGLPYTWKFQWRQRTVISWILIWATLIIGVLISYFVSRLSTDTGTLMYPVQLYAGENAIYISILQYVIMTLALAMALSYIIIKLSTGLSWVFRNIYLTITIVVAIFFIPYIFTVVSPLGSWNPFLYLQLLPVLEGEWAEVGDVNITKMLVAIVLLYILIEILFHFIFKLIPTRTGRLERRKN